MPRVDKLIKTAFPDLSQRQILEAIEAQWVVDAQGKAVKKGLKLDSPSDLNLPKLKEHLESLRQLPFEQIIPVIWEDEQVWIIDKPPQIHCHPISLFDKNTLTQWAFSHHKQTREEFPTIQPTLTPHRLDFDTSGLVVVAKTKMGFETWRERFKNKRIQKRYLAWSWGVSKVQRYEINTSIAHSSGTEEKMVIPSLGTPYREPVLEAQTIALPLESKKGKTLFEIHCTSGVTHQIRIHLASIGYPLLGDALYDPHYQNRPEKWEHHLLRAYSLEWEGQQVKADTTQFIERGKA